MDTRIPDSSRILVVKLADIGDTLLATPALRLLRQSYPKAHIAALVQPRSAEVLQGSTLVDEIIPLDQHRYDALGSGLSPRSLLNAFRELAALRRRRFGVLLLMHHLVTHWGVAKYAALCLASGAPRRVGLDDGRGWFLTHRVPDPGFGYRHEADHCLDLVRAAGAEGQPGGLELPISQSDLDHAVAVVSHVRRPRVVIHPGSGSYSLARRWRPLGFAQVADQLAREYDAGIVLVGGKDEVKLGAEVRSLMRAPALDLTGQTSLRELAAVLGRCDLLVGNDSGVIHVAVASGTPVVAVFGPTNDHAWRPYQPSLSPEAHRRKHQVARITLPCSPCMYRGHSLGLRNGCPGRDCLRLLTPETVVTAARAAMRGW